MNSAGINIHAAHAASQLLETDMQFRSVMGTDSRQDGDLSVYHKDPNPASYSEVHATLDIRWYLEIDARAWGVKDVNVGITKLTLDGWIEDCDDLGSMHRREPGFHYEYPESAETSETLGSDVDAPTKANISRLSTPKWTVKVDQPTTFDSISPRMAEVDLNRHTIDIAF